ncbi:hypothetical protein QQF64_022790 [Cirrhinus molitorella]|uniref:Uncharacterized protein n=1 Tax=Cirrhinus molitorella TaxID=172907 RepID=A0ABR3L3D2_9TELE
MLRASQHILSLFKAVPPCYTSPLPSPFLVSQPGIYSTPVNGWNTPSCEWRAESAAHVTSNTGAEGLLWSLPREFKFSTRDQLETIKDKLFEDDFLELQSLLLIVNEVYQRGYEGWWNYASKRDILIE